MALFAPAPYRTRRRIARRLTAIAFALVLALALAPSPTRAAGSVQLAMSVSPTIGTPSTQALTWTITVTPLGGPASAFNVNFSTSSSQGPIHCDPGCGGSSGSGVTWFIPLATGPFDLVATTRYRGSGNVASSVTATGIGLTCGNCPQSATVAGPSGSFSVQATPATPVPGSTVHVVINATINQSLEMFVISRLPAGLGPPANVSPAGSWNAGKSQLQWETGPVSSQVLSYDAVVTAAPGSTLTIQNEFGSRWLTPQQQNVSVQVGAAPPTTTPPPTASPTPGATPGSTPGSTPGTTSSPNPTAGPGQGASTASLNPNRPGKITNQSPPPSSGSAVGGVAEPAGASGTSGPSSSDASPEGFEAGLIGFPGNRDGPPLGLIVVLTGGAIGLLGIGAFMVYRSPDSERSP